MENKDLHKNKFDNFIYFISCKLSILYVFCAAIIVYEVISRYVFDSPTTWVHETTTLISGIMFIWGGLHALSMNKHIRITVVYDMLKGKYKFFVNLLISFLLIICIGFMTYTSYLLAKQAWIKPWGAFYMERTGSAWNPPFPAIIKLFLLIILILMFIQVVYRLISSGLRDK